MPYGFTSRLGGVGSVGGMELDGKMVVPTVKFNIFRVPRGRARHIMLSTVRINCQGFSATTTCFGRRRLKGTVQRDNVGQRRFFVAAGL